MICNVFKGRLMWGWYGYSKGGFIFIVWGYFRFYNYFGKFNYFSKFDKE